MVLIILNPTTAHAWNFLVMYKELYLYLLYLFTVLKCIHIKNESKNVFCWITNVTGHLENG